MIIFIIIFSFLFQLSITNIINLNTYIIPLFILSSFSILYPYFKNKFNFIIAITLIGFLYDISMNMTFINTIIYSICGALIIFFNKLLKYNIYTSNFINIIIIIIYNLLLILIFNLINYTNFNFNILVKIILQSQILNLIFGIILYKIVNLLSNILDVHKNID